ncbi:MAG: hypothetical protein ICV83_15075 [Cytophagales bacterium]|nr:hypothetical protein [Cytophagales bacterium]
MGLFLLADPKVWQAPRIVKQLLRLFLMRIKKYLELGMYKGSRIRIYGIKGLAGLRIRIEGLKDWQDYGLGYWGLKDEQNGKAGSCNAVKRWRDEWIGEKKKKEGRISM